MPNMLTPKREVNDAQRLEHLRSLIFLCDAISSLNDSVEAAGILRDLLSPQEMISIANRLRIAILLLDGFSYKDIRTLLGVGENKIARVSTWLDISGDTYRTLKGRTKIRALAAHTSQTHLQRTSIHSQSIWPAVLISDLLTTMSRDNAYKILDILADAKEKPELFRLISKTG